MTQPAPSLFTHQQATPPPTASRTLPPPPGWPAPPAQAVYHELLGEIVAKLAPHTEADPVAILTQLLVAFGAAVGRRAWFQVEATRHHPNEFMLLVGDSAKARKGSSWDHVRRLITSADHSISARILTGLSSGEGLIWAVRDPTTQDPGTPDQRLLVVEPEFASVLKASSREISTLSPTLRCAWDARPLALLTRTSPARATHAHISLIGHITQSELRRHTTTIELTNGYLNRFLIVACRRQRLLPEGGDQDPLHATGLTRRLHVTLQHAQTAQQVTLDPGARELWHDAYARLAQPQPGIIGQITARAEAHTIRLALIYALTDRARTINQQHLQAALALHDYTTRSAAWALQGATGEPLTEQIHAALQTHPAGLTRSQISDTLKHNQPAGRIDDALQTLAHAGRATSTKLPTGGRPAQLWTAIPAS
ncbi:MAG: YfjI family protein [Actinomycetota bacterium]|nr:YfjI family protein [Actinomycetota bacterium]